MRKVVLYTISSLDGAVDDPTRTFPNEVDGPAPPEFDDRMAVLEARLLSTQDAVLLGRNMFDQWSDYWPRVENEPFAQFINSVQKYVVTSRPIDREWGPVEAFNGPLKEIIADITSRPGSDIGVHGSITLAQGLLAADLVDELQLLVGPVLDKEGRRLADTMPGLKRMKLMECEATPTGALWLIYSTR